MGVKGGGPGGSKGWDTIAMGKNGIINVGSELMWEQKQDI